MTRKKITTQGYDSFGLPIIDPNSGPPMPKVKPPKKIIAKRTRKPKANSSVNNVVESNTGNVNTYTTLEELQLSEIERLNVLNKILEKEKGIYYGYYYTKCLEVTALKNKSLWQRIKDVFCYE